jgi:DNA polymerase-3 subunit delta
MSDCRIFLIFGDDEYRVTAKAKALLNERVPEADRALGLETVDGQVNTVDEAVRAVSRAEESLQTMGFFGGAKVTWLRGANFLSDSRTGRSEIVRNRLNALAQCIRDGLRDNQVLVISADKVDKRYALYKACKQAGEVHEYAVADKAHQAEQQAAAVVRDVAGHLGLRMSPEVRGAFLDKVGTDTRQVVNEVEKLATYLGSRREATMADVVAVTCSARNVVGWDLSDAFGERNLSRCLNLVRQLVFQGENPIALVAVLAARVRELMIYREAIDGHWVSQKGSSWAWGSVPPEIGQAFSHDLPKDPRKTHPFRVGILAGQASRFSRYDLQRIHQAIVRVQLQLVSSSLPGALLLEALLIDALRTDRQGAMHRARNRQAGEGEAA